MKIPVILLVFLQLITALALNAGPEMPLPAGAVSRIAAARVVVTPDRLDWTYQVGDPVTFTIEVLVDGQRVPGVRVQYQIAGEQQKSESMDAYLATGSLVVDGGTMEVPGFLRCIATAEINGDMYRGLATAAFDPLDIQPTQTDPEGFDAFWSEQLALIREIPLDLIKTLQPDQCTADVNVYHVNYQTWGRWGYSRFYGMLAEPKKPGKYPAVLQVPGAGLRPYRGDTDLAAEGAIVLTVGIHGIPVDLPGEVYKSLNAGGLCSYPTLDLNDREKYYYRRVYLGCVRGNDVLTSHPNWDGETLIVTGGSQGGMLSIITASLDKRITGLVSNYPAYCDVTGYLHGRAGGWPHMFKSVDMQTPENLLTTRYYDVVNFAKRLSVPGSYAWGYNDETCPPTSMFAAYNVITAPKEIHLQLDMGHRGSREFNEKFNQRVRKMAGLDE